MRERTEQKEAAKRAKADEKAAATQSTLSEHIHMDVGIHKHKLDTLMSSPRFHELPGSVVERVQVFCILNRRFFYDSTSFSRLTIQFYFLRFDYTHRAFGSLAMARTSLGGLGPPTAQTRAQTSVGTAVNNPTSFNESPVRPNGYDKEAYRNKGGYIYIYI